MRESFFAFKELGTKFPESRYAQDSAARMKFLTNSLALYEVKVARYYFNRVAYIAAVYRALASLVGYPRTPANQQALQIMVLSYGKLGMSQLSDDSRRILTQTFPEGDMQLVKAPWWKFWGRGDDGLPIIAPDLPSGQPQPKPWWQFW
jgi:outer membrane protein assembly factor BamD